MNISNLKGQIVTSFTDVKKQVADSFKNKDGRIRPSEIIFTLGDIAVTSTAFAIGRHLLVNSTGTTFLLSRAVSMLPVLPYLLPVVGACAVTYGLKKAASYLLLSRQADNKKEESRQAIELSTKAADSHDMDNEDDSMVLPPTTGQTTHTPPVTEYDDEELDSMIPQMINRYPMYIPSVYSAVVENQPTCQRPKGYYPATKK